MEFDRKKLDALLSLDDESFRTLAKTIADAAGADKAQTDMILANPDMVKRRLSRMSADDAKKLIDQAGEEKSGEIMNMLRERGVDLGR